MSHNSGPVTSYRGPDHCSADGAKRLADRLKRYWHKLGVERHYQIYLVRDRDDNLGGAIYGIKRLPDPIVNVPVLAPRERGPNEPPEIIGPAPRARIKSLIKETLKQFPGITYDAVMGRSVYKGGNGKVPPAEQDARWACMRAVRDSGIIAEITYPQLAKIFNCADHTTALYICSAARREKHAASQKAHRLSEAA